MARSGRAPRWAVALFACAGCQGSGDGFSHAREVDACARAHTAELDAVTGEARLVRAFDDYGDCLARANDTATSDASLDGFRRGEAKVAELLHDATRDASGFIAATSLATGERHLADVIEDVSALASAPLYPNCDRGRADSTATCLEDELLRRTEPLAATLDGSQVDQAVIASLDGTASACSAITDQPTAWNRCRAAMLASLLVRIDLWVLSPA